MAKARDVDPKFSAVETRKRMEAALRGARITGHKAMSDIPPKRNLGNVAKKRTTKKRTKK